MREKPDRQNLAQVGSRDVQPGMRESLRVLNKLQSIREEAVHDSQIVQSSQLLRQRPVGVSLGHPPWSPPCVKRVATYLTMEKLISGSSIRCQVNGESAGQPASDSDRVLPVSPTDMILFKHQLCVSTRYDHLARTMIKARIFKIVAKTAHDPNSSFEGPTAEADAERDAAGLWRSGDRSGSRPKRVVIFYRDHKLYTCDEDDG